MRPFAIAGTTRVVGIVGWPVSHSFSPAMHNAAFAALDLDCCYVPFPVAPGELPAAIDGMRALGIIGLNVTIPHKEAALQLSDPDPEAARVGAVNTLYWDGASLIGTNTDRYGFSRQLDEMGIGTVGTAVVLGAGGAARAVVAELGTRAQSLHIVSRKRSEMLVAGQRRLVGPYSDLDATLLARCELLVDTTPRGLTGEAPLFDLSMLPPHCRVVDLVVRRHTPLLDAARGRNLVAHNGEAMLLHQGARAFALWTGAEAPLSVMRAALTDAMAAGTPSAASVIPSPKPSNHDA